MDRARNPEKHRQKQRDWRSKNRDKASAYSKKWQSKNQNKVRNTTLKYKYGVSDTELQRIFAYQNGICAICEEAPAKQLDHDHETGQVRGMLCLNCNASIGLLREDARILERAINYLNKWGATPKPKRNRKKSAKSDELGLQIQLQIQGVIC